MNTTNPALSGEWTIHHAAQCHQTLLALVEGGATEFDLSGVTDFDSAGLQLLLAARQSLALDGRELLLCHVPTAVSHVLNAYGLDTTLNPLPEEACA